MNIKPIKTEKDYKETLKRLEVIFDAEPGTSQGDELGTIGYKSRVSEILNKKRKLTLDMIRKLHVKLNIPTSILIKEY